MEKTAAEQVEETLKAMYADETRRQQEAANQVREQQEAAIRAAQAASRRS